MSGRADEAAGRRWLGPAWERGAAYVTPLLLALVALHQIALAHRDALNPWKGGGFGMFATSDRGGLRDLRVDVLGPDGERRVAVPEELEGLRRRAKDLPSSAHLRALARAVAARLAEPPPALRVEVGLFELDLERGRVQRRVLRSHVVKRARDAD